MAYLFSFACPPTTADILVQSHSHLIHFLNLSVSAPMPPPWWDLIFPYSVSSCLSDWWYSVSLLWMRAPWAYGLAPFTTVVSSMCIRVLTHRSRWAQMRRVGGGGRRAGAVRAGACPLLAGDEDVHSQRSAQFCCITQYLLLWVPLPACQSCGLSSVNSVHSLRPDSKVTNSVMKLALPSQLVVILASPLYGVHTVRTCYSRAAALLFKIYVCVCVCVCVYNLFIWLCCVLIEACRIFCCRAHSLAVVCRLGSCSRRAL